MAFGKSTENFINTYIPPPFHRGNSQNQTFVPHHWDETTPDVQTTKVELTFALFVHKLNVVFCLQCYPKHISINSLESWQ